MGAVMINISIFEGADGVLEALCKEQKLSVGVVHPGGWIRVALEDFFTPQEVALLREPAQHVGPATDIVIDGFDLVQERIERGDRFGDEDAFIGEILLREPNELGGAFGAGAEADVALFAVA